MCCARKKATSLSARKPTGRSSRTISAWTGRSAGPKRTLSASDRCHDQTCSGRIASSWSGCCRSIPRWCWRKARRSSRLAPHREPGNRARRCRKPRAAIRATKRQAGRRAPIGPVIGSRHLGLSQRDTWAWFCPGAGGRGSFAHWYDAAHVDGFGGGGRQGHRTGLP